MEYVRNFNISEGMITSGRCTPPARSSSTSSRKRCSATSGASSKRWWRATATTAQRPRSLRLRSHERRLAPARHAAGSPLTLQISGGEVVLGQWQRILMAELDGPRPAPCARRCGESPEAAERCVHASARRRTHRHRRQDRGARAPDVRRRRAAVRDARVPGLGWLANRERERRHGDRTYFNHNMRLEVTNVCVASCLFCSFARLKHGKPGAHTMSVEQKLEARARDGEAAHRSAHRQRAASGSAVQLLHGAAAAASSACDPAST